MNRIEGKSCIGIVLLFTLIPFVSGCGFRSAPTLLPPDSPKSAVSLSTFQAGLMKNLHEQVTRRIRYRDGYYKGGEPPAEVGVCTDVVSRAFRAVKVDLKKRVDKDIAAHPERYHMKAPDPNIDYRRCRNLIVFFRLHTQELTTKPSPSEYLPGDVVFWSTHNDSKPDHVGMVGDAVDQTGVPAIVQHWPGQFVEQTTGLFNWKIMGHFRWKSV